MKVKGISKLFHSLNPALSLPVANRKYLFRLNEGAYTVLLHDPAIGPVNFFSEKYMSFASKEIHLVEDNACKTLTYERSRLALRNEQTERCNEDEEYSYLQCWQREMTKRVTCRAEGNR